MSAALRGMLAAQDTHGNSRGLEGPSGDDCVGHTTRCVGRAVWHIGDMLATHEVSATLHVVLAAKDIGTPEGSRDPQGGVICMKNFYCLELLIVKLCVHFCVCVSVCPKV